MNQIWNNIKERALEIVFIILLCICFFGNNIYLSFATDTYATFHNFGSISEMVAHVSGRLLTGLVYKLWEICGAEDELFYFMSHAVAVVLLAAAVYQLQDLLKGFIVNDYYRICICFLTVANVFIIEYFMFLEKMMFLLAILLNVSAFRCMVDYFQFRRLKYVPAAFVCMLLAVFTYQGTVALSVVLCLPFAYKYAGSVRGYIQNMLLVVLNYGTVCGVNLWVITVIFKSGRYQKSSSLLDKAVYVMKGIVQTTIYSLGILPKYVFVLFLVLIIGVSAVNIFIRYSGMKLWLQMGNLLAVTAGTAAVSTASILLGNGWFAPRVVYPYASILGICIINLHVNILDAGDRTGLRYERNTILVLWVGVVCFLSVQYLYFGKIVKDKYLNNFIDCYRCKMIGEKIRGYEEETGIEITKISFYRDSQTDLQYDGIFHEGDLIVSSFLTEWSDLSAINYYLNAGYVKGEAVEQYQEYFRERDWKVFSDEQILFEGDTLHLCVY